MDYLSGKYVRDEDDQVIPDYYLNKALAEKSFYEFFKQAFKQVLEPGRSFQDNWHIKYLCDTYQAEVERVARNVPKDNDYIVNIPFRSFKSLTATVSLNAWAWGPAGFPWIRFQTVSYSYELTVDHSNKTRKIIKSDWYQNRWGHVFRIADTIPGKTLLKDGEKYFENDKGGFRFATSVGSTATGKGGHINIVDDPHAVDEKDSQPKRDYTKKWVKGTFRSRVDDFERDVFIIIHQRVNQDDITGELLSEGFDNDESDKGIKHICIPAQLNDKVKPESLKDNYKNGLFHPERFSIRVLNQLKSPRTGIGQSDFNTQVQQNPQNPEGNIFKAKWFTGISRKEIPRNVERIGEFWDTAFTKDEKNSATAVMRGILADQIVYITDFDYRWVEFPEQIEWMKNRRGPHFVEAKATGKSAVQTLNSQGITAQEVEVEGKSGDKTARANLITPHVAAGRVKVANHIKERLLKDEKQGLLSFPEGHTDVGDTFVMLVTEFLGTYQVFDKSEFDDILDESETPQDHKF